MPKKPQKSRRKPLDSKKNSEEGGETDELVKPPVEFIESTSQWFEKESKKRGISQEELFDQIKNDGFLVEFEESTRGPKGQVKLTFLGNVFTMGETGKMKAVGEKGKEAGSPYLSVYRDLAENFAPVHAGIEWHRAFTSGGGFTVRSDEPRDKHKKEVVEYIKTLCKKIYQDEYVIGLDTIIDIMIDAALVDGCAGAEIVYDYKTVDSKTGVESYGIKFEDFVKEELTIEAKEKGGKPTTIQVTRQPSVDEWKKFRGIRRLKIIPDAVNRCIPYRHPKSYEVLYWTIDEMQTAKEGEQPKVKKLLPFQIFWIAWNTKGTNLKGNSLVRPVVSIAELVKRIQKATGKGFERWANKKYFFVCGSEKRPWSPIHIRNFLKVLGMMISNNWAGVPVPTGFDVKEIGGTVFEGRDLLDHLISMICAGMKFPRDFLEYGRTRAGDTAWLAWQVEYGRSQLQLRRAIEQQLFKRHVWLSLARHIVFQSKVYLNGSVKEEILMYRK